MKLLWDRSTNKN